MRRGASEDLHVLRKRILKGDIVKTVLWLAWPIILANLVNMSYNLIDAYWLGKLGKEAFGAPTVSWPLIMLFYSIGFGFSRAGIALIAQYVGAGNLKMANKSAGNLLSFMALISLSISGIGYFLSPPILSLMGVPLDIYPYAVEYIRIIFIGVPIAFIGFAFNTIANSLGDTRTPTYINIVSSSTNMVLDPLFIFGYFGFPAMGVKGAAVATVLSRSIVSIIGSYLLFTGYRGIKITINDLGIEKWWIKKVVSIGTPLTIQQSSNSLGFTIMMSIVSRFGSVAVSAYGVAIRIIDVLSAFTWGINRALSIMVGQNLGAEYYDRTKTIVKKTMWLTTIILVIGSVFIFLTRDLTVAFFVPEKDVIMEGSRVLAIFTWSIPFFGLFFLGGAVAGGSGHTKIFAIISIIRLWVLRIGFSYLLALVMGMGTIGIWVAMAISNIGAGLLALLWVFKGSWARRVID
ncbi:MATE family efflux transporter [Staphylothermus hellenicus]|uniref:MATE efflux family protein n=1 Tax=Staphylothermus hellenicus (strain DSM 12710 / JCM 10830 / BK20S6-10-b1 / P8) TaxID=591019 RepID=D7D8L7_STAHD|nr:MATE family efflux transporter [Staphylothermus hellenicus]ADI32113.1 MATE efflux family protein [Staphylothermus hellenicus DSM 12710]